MPFQEASHTPSFGGLGFRGFLEYALHRGFIADPARAGHLKDKPKVEVLPE